MLKHIIPLLLILCLSFGCGKKSVVKQQAKSEKTELDAPAIKTLNVAKGENKKHGVLDASNLAKGLVAYYPFNGNAKDESVNDHNGTVNGATLTTDRYGAASKAYSFDGVDDHIIAPDTGFPAGAAPRTISMWVTSLGKKAPENNHIINYGTHASIKAFGLIFADTLGQGLYFYGHGNHLEVYPGPRLFGDWKHMVATYDGATLRTYHNGNPAQTETKTLNTVLNQFVMGTTLVLGPNNSFWGNLDDVRIYNRALSAEEVKALYDLEKPKGK